MRLYLFLAIIIYFAIAIFTIGAFSNAKSGAMPVWVGFVWPLTLVCMMFFSFVNFMFWAGKNTKELIVKIKSKIKERRLK